MHQHQTPFFLLLNDIMEAPLQYHLANLHNMWNGFQIDLLRTLVQKIQTTHPFTFNWKGVILKLVPSLATLLCFVSLKASLNKLQTYIADFENKHNFFLQIHSKIAYQHPAPSISQSWTKYHHNKTSRIPARFILYNNNNNNNFNKE